MTVKDQSAFYSAGAEAMRLLASRCADGRLAQIFEDQAQRFLRMAKTSARTAAAAPAPSHIVRAQRPRFMPGMALAPVSTNQHHAAKAAELRATCAKCERSDS